LVRQLDWTQYRQLIQIQDTTKREYYELEAINNAWTVRELEQQINSQLYLLHVRTGNIIILHS